MNTKTSEATFRRESIGSMFIGLGLIVFISGLFVNPWVVHLYRTNGTNFLDVTWTYFVTAIVVGCLIAGLGLILRKTSWKGLEGVSLLVVVSALIFLSDRFLLAFVGLPLWVPDAQNHYVHRANAVKTWGPKRGQKVIRINGYGHHDRDFPIEKPGGEFRGLVIGDSITMGHGVTAEETFSSQLENQLGENSDRKFEIINTGVQGYSTNHEYNVLVNSLKFKPDLIVIQFCLNDLTQPFISDKPGDVGGNHFTGVAQQSSKFFSYFLNETGYGRTILRLRDYQKTVENEQDNESRDVRKAAASAAGDPNFLEGWELTLSYLDKMYEVGNRENIRIVLLISPHTFQIVDEHLREPQKILAEHAKSRNIDVIDLVPVFERLIADRATLNKLSTEGVPTKEIEKMYEEKINEYFLDEDHYTVEGHRVVASELYRYLSDRMLY